MAGPRSGRARFESRWTLEISVSTKFDHHRGHRGSQGHAAQLRNYCGDFIVLKETDGGYTGGACFQAPFRIFEGDSAQGQDGYLHLAGFAELSQSCRLRARDIFLFKDWGEDGEVGPVGLGLLHFFWRVT